MDSNTPADPNAGGVADPSQAADTDPSGGASPEGGMDLSSGYKIEILVAPGKPMLVGVEPLAADDEDDEDAEQGGSSASESGDDDDYQPVENKSEALHLVGQIIDHAGDMEAVGGGDRDMAAGYGDDNNG